MQEPHQLQRREPPRQVRARRPHQAVDQQGVQGGSRIRHQVVEVADRPVRTVGSGSALYTLDAVTGTPKWRFAAGGDVVGAPV
ncbi:hypothetical protein ABZT07_31015, partial [Streptomyces sp. NPDC005317]|uniref:hypothetical protein n=1 Tax=Streptomyces sp. NPDC005317 TaxID=3156876 RepID=UPI0033A5E66C